MKTPLEVRILAEPEYDLWSAFLRATPGASIYSCPSYLDALCSATGGRFQVLAALRGDEIAGGVALYQERRPYGMAMTDRLLLYYHPVVLREYATRYPSERTSRQIEILSALGARLDAMPCARLVLHSQGLIDARPFLSRGWTARPAYSYVVPVAGLEAAWNRVDQNQRRLVTRCEAQGGRLYDDDDFDTFFRLHEQVHLRKHAPLYLPREAFERFVRRLIDLRLAKIFHVRMADGRSLAAQLNLLGPFRVSHTVCAGADEEGLKIGSTPFLRWKVFETVAGLGYEANDLTDASLNPVTHFKSQLGGDLVTNTVLSRPDRLFYVAYDTLRKVGQYAARMPDALRRRTRLLGARLTDVPRRWG